MFRRGNCLSAAIGGNRQFICQFLSVGNFQGYHLPQSMISATSWCIQRLAAGGGGVAGEEEHLGGLGFDGIPAFGFTFGRGLFVVEPDPLG